MCYLLKWKKKLTPDPEWAEVILLIFRSKTLIKSCQDMNILRLEYFHIPYVLVLKLN